jgi:hypothetical protein
MGHRVLGITYDADRIRVAVVETRLRRFELTAAFDLPREAHEPAWAGSSPDRDPDETIPGLALKTQVPRVLDRLNEVLTPPLNPGDSIALAFPGDQGFVRRLSFPFRETDKITATLPGQMIGVVPVQVDDIHCTFERIPGPGAGAEVLAVAVMKSDLSAFLDTVRAEGLVPAHVSVDGVCLASLLPYVGRRDGGSLVVWADGERAELLAAVGERTVLVRSVFLGEPVASGEEASPALLREVLLTAAAASESGAALGGMFIAGPRAESLTRPLEEALRLPCQVLDPAGLPIPGAHRCQGLDPALAKAVALAIGAASGGGAGSVNLRIGTFGPKEGYSLFRDHLRLFVAAVAVFAVLGASKAVARYYGLQAERDEATAELKAFTAKVLGKERDDFDGALKAMKSLGEEDLRIFPKWTAVDSLNRVLGILMEVGKPKAGATGAGTGTGMGTGGTGTGTGAWGEAPGGGEAPITAPDAYTLEVENVRIEPRVLSIRGEADTIDTLDLFVKRLDADPCLYDVVTESTERIQFQRHQGWQRFSLRMAVDCAPKDAAKKAKPAPAAEKGEK